MNIFVAYLKRTSNYSVSDAIVREYRKITFLHRDLRHRLRLVPSIERMTNASGITIEPFEKRTMVKWWKKKFNFSRIILILIYKLLASKIRIMKERWIFQSKYFFKVIKKKRKKKKRKYCVNILVNFVSYDKNEIKKIRKVLS